MKQRDPYSLPSLLIREAIPFTMALFSLSLAINNYPLLPDQIPLHFGPGGTPDRWADKSWGLILLLPAIQLGSYLLIATFTLLSASTHNFTRFINLPGANPDGLTHKQLSDLRRVIVTGLYNINLATMGMLTYINYGLIQTGLERWQGLGSMVWFFLGLIALLSGWLVFACYNITRRQKSPNSRRK